MGIKPTLLGSVWINLSTIRLSLDHRSRKSIHECQELPTLRLSQWMASRLLYEPWSIEHVVSGGNPKTAFAMNRSIIGSAAVRQTQGIDVNFKSEICEE
jgi:hypothetical protein